MEGNSCYHLLLPYRLNVRPNGAYKLPDVVEEGHLKA